MPTKRQLFLDHVAQTSPMPLMLEVDHAKGIYIYDVHGKAYMDLNSGICVSAMGHCHPDVVKAIKDQVDKHLHTMVYGEHLQAPQVKLANLLTEHLPSPLNSVYFVMSGSEAVEGAMKLAKRYTGKYEIVCCRNAYHGSTQGAESLRSDIDFVQAFRPLIPGIRFIDFNDETSLDAITNKTACVITEPIQAESGVQLPNENFLKSLREKCNTTGALLVLDEIQTGFGRTGSLFAFEQYGIEPDILLTAKGLGGGMPIGAFIASKEMMSVFTRKPVLGHITTFGGHPVSCASAHAALNALLNSDLIDQVKAKGQLFQDLLQHEKIKEVRGKGLMLAVEMSRKKYMKYVVQGAIENGMLVDWFLFNNGAFRLAPPLIITEEQIREACKRFIQILDMIN